MTQSEQLNGPFNFGRHRADAVQKYQRIREQYVLLADCFKSILKEAISEKEIKVASIDARAKTVESFGAKAMTPHPEDPANPKYTDPVIQITDLAGVRIITFFPRTVDDIDEVIRTQFVVIEKSDKGDILEQEDRFGYQSVHYLVRLAPDRHSLPEYSRFKDFVVEIQVRTVLQHAWAEIEHDIQYKSMEAAPLAIRRRFMALAGMLELADREFQAIQDEDHRLTQEARRSVAIGNYQAVEMTPDALRAYLNRRLGSDGRISQSWYQWTAEVLRSIGFTNFRQIDECIQGYDDDALSRILWGTRQGQVSRFESMLLAGMGEEFIKRHPVDNETWRKIQEANLAKFKAAGVHIRTYVPSKGL